MVNRNIYLITSPALALEAFRSPNLAFEPFSIEPGSRIFRFSKDPIDNSTRTEQRCPNAPSAREELNFALHDGLARENFRKLILSSLNRFSFVINGMGQVTELESLYGWIRKTMALATSRALFGAEDPLNKDHDLLNERDFNDGLSGLIIGFCPSIFAPRAYRARAALQAAFSNYYLNHHEDERDVSHLIKERAKIYRERGIDPLEIAKQELSLLQLFTGDPINIAFWLFIYIATDPVARDMIRIEIMAAIRPETGRAGWEDVILNIATLEERCPQLVSAYKEAERLVVSQVSIRRVVEDTVISDGECNYMLKEDADVQIPAGLCHLSKEVWGKHADAFNFRRFYTPVTTGDAARRMTQPDPAEEAAQQALFRSRMQAFFPFGGGKHLCPGRQYASVQILALIVPLIVGFDIKSRNGGFIERPEMVRGRLGEAVSRPSTEGMRMGAILIRREQWQGAVWKYVSDRFAER